MSTEISEIQKTQTKHFIGITSREKYIQILEVVGRSPKPLPTRKIETTWYDDYYIHNSRSRAKNKKGKSHAYIYNMIQKLAGFESNDHIPLISWNEFVSKAEEEKYKLQTVNTINKIFGIPIKIEEKDGKRAGFDIQFRTDHTKKDGKTFMFFEVKKNHHPLSRDLKNVKKSVLEVIGLDFDKGAVNLTIRERPNVRELIKIPIIVKIKNRKQEIHENYDINFYIKSSDIPRKNIQIIPLLKYTLKESAKNKISELRKNMKKYPFYVSGTNHIVGYMYEDISDEKHYLEEIQKIKNNPRNFRYYLSLRGFLHCLLPIKSKVKISDETDKPELISTSKPNTNRKINKIIKSLIENQYTKNDYPFLQKYHIFDIIYGSDYKIKVLKEIAFELQNQLDQSDNFLIYRITKRYHDMMLLSPFFPSNPIFRNSNIPFLHDIIKNSRKKGMNIRQTKELFHEMKEYHINMTRLLLEYQEQETNLTRQLLDDIEHNPLFQY